MRILVLSDLHIDNGDKFGAFGWNEDEFISHLEKIREIYQIDKLILNGDVFELYKYSLTDIHAAFPKLTAYLESEGTVYIKGNHDIINSFGRDFYQIENSSGKIIHIEHGHNADFLNGTAFGRFIARIGFAALKNTIHLPFVLNWYFKIIKLTENIEHIPKKYDSYKYLKYALKLLKNYDVVILGHTHKIETHKTYYLNDKKRYLNCGSCSMGRFQAIVLDTETLEHETIKQSRPDIQKIKESAGLMRVVRLSA
jgi:predicted phosphodiesterase